MQTVVTTPIAMQPRHLLKKKKVSHTRCETLFRTLSLAYNPAAVPACSSFVASTLPSYDSIVFVIITVVVSPRWMVWAVVVTVRVTLQPLRMPAINRINRITSIAVTSNCFLVKFIIHSSFLSQKRRPRRGRRSALVL